MSDSFGSLCDKLATCNHKLFLVQDTLYVIRKMTFDEFKETYGSEEGLKVLHECFSKSMNLNVQRQALIQELDEKIAKMVSSAVEGKDMTEGGFVQPQFKTY